MGAMPDTDLMSTVERVLKDARLLENPYLQRLANGEMNREDFCLGQRQFYFAVNFFSRPMSGLLMRLECPKMRLGILGNVVEEHGDFQPARFHEATFRDFLSRLGEESAPQVDEIGPAVHAFNSTIMAACVCDDVEVGIACLGIIEYAFADISAMIGKAVVARGWVEQNELVHYSLHAEIDKQHAADFFKLLEPGFSEVTTRAKSERGLRLGAYAFDRLYRDLL